MQAKKIFYAWQADQPPDITRKFIRDAIVAAINRLNGVAEVEDADDVERLQIDHDTSGVSGSPPIAETICKKIDACAAFVADLTLVGGYKNAHGKSKKIVHGNVLVELGYARRARGLGRLITVQNTHFGSARELPFDLTHLRHPIAFYLPPGAPIEKHTREMEGLTDTLVDAIRSVMQESAQADAATATVTFKGYLADKSHEIGLRDFLFDSIDSVRDAIANQELQTSRSHTDAFRGVLDRYQEKCQALLSHLALGGHWGQDYHSRYWVEAIENLANMNQYVSGLDYLLRLRWYPTLAATYALGLGATYRRNYGTLYQILTRPMATAPPGSSQNKEPTLVLASVWFVFQNDQLLSESMFPAASQHAFPASAYMRKTMRNRLLGLLPDESKFNEIFDRFEYLLALAYAQLDPRQSGPIGEFARLWRRGVGNNPAVELEGELKQSGPSHPLLAAGFFEGQLDKLTEAKRRLDEAAFRSSFHRV